MNTVAILEFCENAKGPTWLMWVCVSEKSNLKEKKEKKKKKHNAKLCMMNLYPKLCIQNNLPNTIKCKNGLYIYIYIYSIIELKYIKKRENEKWIHHFLEPNKALL